MKKSKKFLWFYFAGCCCAGLLLVGGERTEQTKLNASDSTAYGSATYCPYIFYAELGGVYYFGAYQNGANCIPTPQSYMVTDTRYHSSGPCGVCPDPIISTSHPILSDVPEPALVPQSDPMFGGTEQ